MLTLGNAIKDELDKTFSRYMDLRNHNKPEPFHSIFAPPEEEKPIAREPDKEEKKVPAPAEIFDILSCQEEEVAKKDEDQDYLYNSPLKPANDPADSNASNPISKLNEIMAKMQLEEQEATKKQEEEKKKQDAMNDAFSNMNMMGPGWMPYPGYPPPMGFPSPFATNMPMRPYIMTDPSLMPRSMIPNPPQPRV